MIDKFCAIAYTRIMENGKSKSIMIYEKVLRELASGAHGKIGTRFLSARQFAAQYGVSFVTAVKILRMLQEDGLLSIRGNSYFVRDCSKKPKLPERKITFGVHVRDVGNDFYSRLCAHLAQQAAKHNVNLLVMTSNNDIEEKQSILDKFLALGCDGLINLNSIEDYKLSDYFKLYPLPIVHYGTGELKTADARNVDFVDTTSTDAGAIAAKHLKEIGCEKFFYVSVEHVGYKGEDPRYNKFRASLRAYHADAPILTLKKDDNGIIHSGPTIDTICTAAKTAKVGVLCAHDLLAATVIASCNSRGVGIPDPVAVIGYDDLPICTYIKPSITTFGYNYTKIAESCIRLLLERIENPQVAIPPRAVQITSFLNIRSSTRNKNTQ